MPQPTQQGIDRRKQIAQALMRVSQQPTGLSGPWGGIVSALAGGIGGWQQGKAGMEQKQVDDGSKRRLAEALAGMGGDPKAVEAVGQLPLEQQQGMLGKLAVEKMTPKQAEGFTLSPNQRRYDGAGKEIAAAPAEPAQPYTLGPGSKRFGADNQELASVPNAPTAATNINLNTEKGLYGTLAEQQGKQYSDLYARAQGAPERIERAARVRALLKDGSITGAGANQKLAIARGLKAAGIYQSDDIANTELLGRELAGSTLEAVKASGLGAGSGFSNADRDFLEKVAGGQITQDAATLERIAELNDRAARAEVTRWNETAGRLQPEQLKTLGMQPIQIPQQQLTPTGRPNGIQDLINDPKYRSFFQQ